MQHIFCREAGFSPKIEVAFVPDIRIHRIGDQIARALPLQFERVRYEDLGPRVEEPTFTLNREEAQELLEELWRLGVRPRSGEGNFGQLGATERHLADMRRLVFKEER